MSLTATAPAHQGPTTFASRWVRPALLVGMVAVADQLLLDLPGGVAWFAFFILLAIAVTAAHPSLGDERALLSKVWLLLLATAPLIENVSTLSLGVAAAALAAFALSLSKRLQTGLVSIARQLVWFFITAPFRLAADASRLRRAQRRLDTGWRPTLRLAVWIMPAICGAVFISLFGVANPIIAEWLARIDILAWIAQLDIGRALFWLVAACVVWAYLRPRARQARRRKGASTFGLMLQAAPLAAPNFYAALFGRAALLRALLLFNALFGVQTVLDVAYLWAGVQLPDDLTYAAYAHRGAYALIATALIAAGFVLTAMKPGSATSRDPLVRKLVYLWIAQNVVLVLSSILRLDLYVGVYSLTYWRIAALLWMALVAVGLVLIIVRIALDRSNQWLVSANLLTLSLLIYSCCYINFGKIIANYNVDHSREMATEGKWEKLPIDVAYLRDLGPAAFPAIDRLLAKAPADGLCFLRYTDYEGCLTDARDGDESEFRQANGDWRNWTYRNVRLTRYLDARATRDLARQ